MKDMNDGVHGKRTGHGGTASTAGVRGQTIKESYGRDDGNLRGASQAKERHGQLKGGPTDLGHSISSGAVPKV